MSVPEFRPDGWLPEGHHPATWDEIAARFGGAPGSRRAAVLSGLLQWRDAVRAKGMGGLAILDGSFISEKAAPGDFDCIFVYNEATRMILAQDVEASDLFRHTTIKNRFGGDVFVYSYTSVRDSPAFCRTDGFDYERVTRKPKGVIEVTL